MTPSGPVDGPSENIAANSRKTYNVSKTVHGCWEVSTRITSNKGIIAERSMYGINRTWATNSVGVSETSNTWYLAEGCTAPEFETWVLVQNPGNEKAGISLTYMTPEGPVKGPEETLAPRSRKTYEVARTVPLEWSVSTKVTSDKPIVTERAVYGKNRTWAHDSLGAVASAKTWYLAEGSTGTGFETWVLLQNPNASEAKVTLTYIAGGGEGTGPQITLAANSRTSENVAQLVPCEPEGVKRHSKGLAICL